MSKYGEGKYPGKRSSCLGAVIIVALMAVAPATLAKSSHAKEEAPVQPVPSVLPSAVPSPSPSPSRGPGDDRPAIGHLEQVQSPPVAPDGGEMGKPSKGTAGPDDRGSEAETVGEDPLEKEPIDWTPTGANCEAARKDALTAGYYVESCDPLRVWSVEEAIDLGLFK